MSQNANTIDAQQMHTDGGNAATEVPSPQATLRTEHADTTTYAVVDAPIFAGTTNKDPVQARDGTAPLSFVPIGGAFTNNATAQTKPTDPSILDKDREDHAPSPLALPSILPQSEENTSPPPIPI